MAAAQGLFNALYTGLAAAETAERYLSNAADVPPSYERAIADIWNTYAERLAFLRHDEVGRSPVLAPPPGSCSMRMHALRWLLTLRLHFAGSRFTTGVGPVRRRNGKGKR